VEICVHKHRQTSEAWVQALKRGARAHFGGDVAGPNGGVGADLKGLAAPHLQLHAQNDEQQHEIDQADEKD
jgi:hypothetical protein